jgi:DNA-binding response OmpR family regulator
MKILMIDDHPDLKAHDKDLDLSTMIVARDIESGIKAFEGNPRFDTLYLDGRLPDGSFRDILIWLSDHLDKVPMEIINVSFSTTMEFYPMVEALQATVRRHNLASQSLP